MKKDSCSQAGENNLKINLGAIKVNKSIPLILFLLVIFGMKIGTVSANTNDSPQPFEEIFPEIGYKTVEEALEDAEQHLKKELQLPTRVPPISFTHHFGRFSNLDGNINDTFEVKFISDQLPENHYKIDIRPVKYKIPIREKYVLKTFKLKNGNLATYMSISGFNTLVFDRDNWQYMLSIDKRLSNLVPPETLVEIANSIK